MDKIINRPKTSLSRNKNIIHSFNTNYEINSKFWAKKDPFEFLYPEKTKLNDIDLYEKNNRYEIYDWQNLFNNFTSINSYIRVNNNLNNKNKINESNSSNFEQSFSTKQIKNFFEDSFVKYRTEKPRPKSMYSNKKSNYSNTYNNFEFEDYKLYSIPIILNKLKVNWFKFRHKLYMGNKTCYQYEKELSKKYNDIDTDDLIIAAQKRNPLPLLKRLYKEKHGTVFDIKKKLSLNMIKSYAKNFRNIADKYRLTQEKISKRYQKLYDDNMNNKNLILDNYNVKDPHIILFNERLKNIKKREYSNQYINKFLKEDNRNKNSERAETSNRNYSNILYQNYPYYSNRDAIKFKTIDETQKYEIKGNLLSDYNSRNMNYIAHKSFPLKHRSNTSYNKINDFIKQRNAKTIDIIFNPRTGEMKKRKKDKKSRKTNTDNNNIKFSVKIKPKKLNSIYTMLMNEESDTKRMKNKNHKKFGTINCVYFNEQIKTKYNKDLIKFNRIDKI